MKNLGKDGGKDGWFRLARLGVVQLGPLTSEDEKKLFPDLNREKDGAGSFRCRLNYLVERTSISPL